MGGERKEKAKLSSDSPACEIRTRRNSRIQFAVCDEMASTFRVAKSFHFAHLRIGLDVFNTSQQIRAFSKEKKIQLDARVIEF